MSNEELPYASIQIIKTIFNEDKIQSHFADKFDRYFAACKLITDASGIKLNKPAVDIDNPPDGETYLRMIAENNNLRLRQIRLKPSWSSYDSGSMLLLSDSSLSILFPCKKGGYELVDLADGCKIRITKKNEAKYIGLAYIFYPTLSQLKPTTLDICKFTFSSLKKDISKIILIQVLCSLLMLLVPIITGVIFDNVIVYSNFLLLGQYSFLLFIIALIIEMLSLVQTNTILHLRMKATHQLQVGIWDRLLRLPLSFFKKYSVGELSFRTGVVNAIHQELGAATISTIISGFLVFVNLALMLYINSYLAMAAIILVLISAVVTSIFSLLIMRNQRKVIMQNSILISLLYGLVNSIMKIRVAHKESAAFQVWNQEFSDRIIGENKVFKYTNAIDVFNIAFMGFSTLIVYSIVILLNNKISFGDFIIFNAAFIQFFSSIIALANTISESLEIFPLYQLAKPIFDTPLEDNEHKNPAVLDGRIVLQNIVFRYPNREKPIFVDFNLTVEPGSFTAIVGSSGSGKSTLLRLLLGLEEFESGDIKYNGISIKNLPLHDLRSQLGVVLQTTKPIPGTIFENIAGKNYNLTRKEALEIIEKVGLDNTIRNLPMGLDTLLNDGLQTLSGGEIQRLNLARAISASPKILLLDEATSALDNKLQKKVHDYLKAINVTRLVIAHRFSTIVQADMIHVIEDGRCIESGNYQELMAKKGVFHYLASFQCAYSENT